jgi:hypothetical protein
LKTHRIKAQKEKHYYFETFAVTKGYTYLLSVTAEVIRNGITER